MILGIDEVGRGPWAGPLVVGAVVLGGVKIIGLTDSKKLTKRKRELLDVEIRQKALGYSTGWVNSVEIDEIGLSAALKLATVRAIEKIKVDFSEIIIDGTVNFLADTNKSKIVTTMKKADLLVPSVSAASIIAKVERDKFMAAQDKIFHGYGFNNNVGYGTEEHISAIDRLGITNIHRLSFKPLRKYSQLDGKKTSKSIGDKAESAASKFLEKHGHKIIERNWKTKYCEIDIISLCNKTLYFNEVKYRRQSNYGDGLDAITSKKIKQMKFAANFYITTNKIPFLDMRLSAMSLDGDPPSVTDFLEID